MSGNNLSKQSFKNYVFLQSVVNMEFKRKIARIFLLSAVLMLIMNNVLPHHHHKEDVCYATSHCSENETDHHDESESDHQGEGHDHDADFCQLDVYYLATYWKDPAEKSKYSNAKKTASQIALTFNDTGQVFKSLYFQLQLFSNHKTVLDSRSLTRALRAPPHC